MKLKSTLIVLSLIAAPAFASDQVVSKTREQVQAELAHAMQSGDMLASGESGLTLKQLNPGAYPATASAQVTKSRDQVRDELEQAIRSGVNAAAVQAKRGIGRRFALPASIVVGAACIWWIAGAAQPWRPDVSKVRRIPFATEEYGESWATWSPDGRSIAYVGRYREPGENGVTDKLIIRSRDGSPPFVVARHDVIGQIAWPSDQSRLFYMATSKGKGEPDVYAVSTAGGAPTALLNSGIKVRALAISPDAKTLAVLRAVTVNDRVRTQLWLSSPPGSAPVQVQGFEGECCMQPFGLVWMPDGKSLLASIRSPESYGYWRIEARGGSRKIADQSLGYIRAVEPSGHYAILAGAGSLWWMNTATAARSLLMADTQWIGTPALSRDGRQLAFTVGRSRPYLIAVPLDGSPPRRLGMSQVDETDPEWCKRTGEFAFVRGSEIRVRSRDGAERVAFAPRNVPNLPETDALRFPAFSPDGERMAFTTEGSAMSNVYIAPVRGGQITPLHGGDEKDRPSWSPDGAWIAYDSPVRGVVTIKKIRVGSTDPPIELGRHECVPQWSPAGSSILCAAPHEGLLVLAADGKGERSLGTEYTPPAAWSQDGNAIYAIRKSGERRELVQIAVSSGAVRKIVEIPPDLTLPGFHDPPSFSMAPDGKSLAGISRDDLGDIWILEGFETPRTFWERLWPVKQ